MYLPGELVGIKLGFSHLVLSVCSKGPGIEFRVNESEGQEWSMVCSVIISALKTLRQEGCQVQASMGYTVRPSQKKKEVGNQIKEGI